MAAKKRPVKRKIRRRYGRRYSLSPKEHEWRLWCHDVDTLMHEMVKNPALTKMSPEKIIARAEAFADAYRAMQDRRRPAGVAKEVR
jgi:hypothetical protein